MFLRLQNKRVIKKFVKLNYSLSIDIVFNVEIYEFECVEGL